MSVENVKKFRKDLEENEELKNNVKKELEVFKDSGKKEKELIPEIARKLGYDFTVEEFKEESSKLKEVNDKELANVSGGVFGLGDDAPDGNEVGCLLNYYISWHEYYFRHRICPKCKSTNVNAYDPRSAHSVYTCNDCGAFTQE